MQLDRMAREGDLEAIAVNKPIYESVFAACHYGTIAEAVQERYAMWDGYHRREVFQERLAKTILNLVRKAVMYMY